MRLGYNTNGLAHHRLIDAVELLAEEGYRSVALTLETGALDPYDDPASLDRKVIAARKTLDRLGLSRVIERCPVPACPGSSDPRHGPDPAAGVAVEFSAHRPARRPRPSPSGRNPA